MPKRTPPPTPQRQPITAATAHQSHAAAIRELIESIAIAFVLAFLFRTFEAEAFVIPTGSMAPTLKGRHKDLECPQCHYNFQVSASEEVDRDGKAKQDATLIDRCICPMCRYVWDGKAGPIAMTSYNGDRILVNKFAYEFNDPKRWDVIVFKFPNKSQENYIKRLIGLPGETVRVHRGDIFIQGKDAEGNILPFEIARKPPEKLRVMLQPVFDNDFMPTIEKLGWPVRWQAGPPPDGSAAGQWTSADHAVYETDGSAAGETWLRYEHLVPSASQWKEHERESSGNADPIKPQLITDFTAYNSGGSDLERQLPRHDIYGRRLPADAGEARRIHWQELTGKHWVGDLALSCQAEVENDRGQIVLELVKAGRKFQCRLDVGSGQADFSIDGVEQTQFDPQFQTVLHGPGKYDLMFANCDRRLYLWINGSIVQFADYPDLQNDLPNAADLQPVGVASSGVKMKLSHLKIFRDIYYIATSLRERREEMYDYISVPPDIADGNFEQFFSDPRQWRRALDDNNMAEVDFRMYKDELHPEKNEFFAMGDNSAKSSDSRFWGTVPRELLIGKAFFVYWPHSWDRVPGTKIPFPYFPNFPRMGFVR